MNDETAITLNFLYQLIGQKEVELAALRERVIALAAEVAEVRKLIDDNQNEPTGDGEQ